MQNNALVELVQLDELSGEKFSINQSINNSKEILENLKEYDEIFENNFEDNTWIFEDHLLKGSRIYFDFNILEKIVKFNKKWNRLAIVLVKCWVAELLNDFYPKSINNKYRILVNIIEKTDFFSVNNVNYLIEYLRNYNPLINQDVKLDDHFNLENIEENIKKDNQGNKHIYEIINTSINFLTFSELDALNNYRVPLLDIRKSLPFKIYSRNLPKSEDVLTLDFVINSYFIKGFNSHSRLFYAPIFLWWKITNVIPIRISEFCNMKRDCIDYENGKYYITLPREKKKATNRRIQIVDTFETSKEIYELIYTYTDFTNKYGKSITLLSYRSILALDDSCTGRLNKNNMNYFNRINFKALLKKFYKDIVYKEFSKNVTREVRPNDTRHFAFCSLLLQGLSPIEIARLGGHSTLEAQYHYSNHTEYYIDLEVKKLMENFKLQNIKENEKSFKSNEISLSDIENKSLQFPSKDNNTRYPMDIGFCTDELQRCESEECMLCKHWWIHPNNIENVKPIIQNKILKRKKKIVELSDFLKNLNEKLTKEMVKNNEVHPNIYSKLKTNASSIKAHIEELARLEILRGDNKNV